MYHLNSIKKTMRILRPWLLTVFAGFLLVTLIAFSSTVSAFASDISGRSNAALAVVNEVSLSFTVVSDTETAGHSTIELWSGLNTTDGNASDDTNKIPVNNGKAILPQAGEGDVYTYRISADGCYTCLLYTSTKYASCARISSASPHLSTAISV